MPNPGKRTWLIGAVAFTVVVGAALVALTFPRPSESNVVPGKANSITSDDGRVTVEIPSDAVDDAGVLSITPIQGDDAAWSIDLVGTELVGEAVIRFAVDTSEPGTPTPAVVFRESGQDRQIVSDVERGDGEVVVRTTHFSEWWVIDWGAIKQGIVDAISRSVSISEDRAPTCEGEEEARESYDVRSDEGRRVYWCLGIENGETVLKAVNGRQYGVAAEYTPGLRRSRLDNTDVVNQIAKLLTPPPGLSSNSVELLSSGNAIEFEVTGEAAGIGVTFQPEPGAYLISALKFAIDTYGMVFDKFGKSDAGERLSLALAGASCLDDLTGMVTTELATAEEATEFFEKALDASFSCVGDLVDEIDLGWILDGIVQPIVWLVSGVKTAIMGFVAAGDILLDVDGYQILVTDKSAGESGGVADLSAFAGTWHGPIEQSGSEPYTTVMTIEAIALAPAGTVIGTVRYPELGDCSGSVTLTGFDSEVLYVTETIDTNTSRCATSVDLTLTLGPGGDTLSYEAPGWDATGVLTRGEPDAASPGAAGWPTNRDDGPPALYAWMGANMLGLADWVACDRAVEWCLLGYDGGKHLLVAMDGLEIAGEVSAGVSDPSAALVKLGVPSAVAQEILVP